MTMKMYPVLAEGWLEDGAGVGKYRLPGESVRFFPEQAPYLIGSGQIGPAPSDQPVKAPPARSKAWKPETDPPAEGA